MIRTGKPTRSERQVGGESFTAFRRKRGQKRDPEQWNEARRRAATRSGAPADRERVRVNRRHLGEPLPVENWTTPRGVAGPVSDADKAFLLLELECDYLLPKGAGEDLIHAERRLWQSAQKALQACADGREALSPVVARRLAGTLSQLLDSGVPMTWARAAGKRPGHRPPHTDAVRQAKDIAVWYVKAATGYRKPGLDFSGLRGVLSGVSSNPITRARQEVAAAFGLVKPNTDGTSTVREWERLADLERLQDLHTTLMSSWTAARFGKMLRKLLATYGAVYRRDA